MQKHKGESLCFFFLHPHSETLRLNYFIRRYEKKKKTQREDQIRTRLKSVAILED